MINESFYPLTPAVGKKLRQSNLTAAEWRIWTYLVEIDSWGDHYCEFNTLALLQECEISKATFYRALAKFQELEIFDFQDTGFSIRNLYGVSSLKNEKQFSDLKQDSQICESSLKNEKQFSKMRSNSQKCENQHSKHSCNKASRPSQTIQTYQTYTDSLSKDERESFEKLCFERARGLPNPPVLPQKWIEANFEELRSLWESSRKKASKSKAAEWENHPQREEWLEKIRQLGPAGFQAEDMPNQKLRREFYQWATENHLIWGNEL
ncbi:hypothetical protein [Richelia sinica]|uniref:hypothetical protein n=1 Tax=Richelia sinica TaxID=1357545 RepID=UPI0016877208|nr:hypothetical protein [Richelia sinica]MBD2666687.1 hypothetical protein [Richelia sinica FACHB-800]